MYTLEIAVTDDFGIGIVDLQRVEQREESLLLLRGAGVGGLAVGIEASLVADTDGVGVVVAGVCTDHLLGATEVELSVAGDVVVVAAAPPAAGLVHLLEPFHRNMLVRSRGGAVNHNQIYSSHSFVY